VRTTTTISQDGDGDSDPDEARAEYYIRLMSSDLFASKPLPEAGVVTIGRSSKNDIVIPDLLASREHARIRVQRGPRGASIDVEDLGSANGTRVRDLSVAPGQPVAISPGDPIRIGGTLVMVVQDHQPAGLRNIWSHTSFERRLEEDCKRLVAGRSTLALGRFRFQGPAPWLQALPVLAQEVRAPHVFAAYGPQDYEVLFADTRHGEPERVMDNLVHAFHDRGLEACAALAWAPEHGRSADELFAHAHALLRPALSQSAAAREEPRAHSPAMAEVRAMAGRAATSTINVLLLGETGVGKEVLARLIHRRSARSGKLWVALNCAGFAESLLDSELFGFEKNAFTGAASAKIGLLESANGGTVFLDEVGEMPASAQVKLLRVLEAREVLPVGALRPRPLDVRIISATNRDLEADVAAGKFRRDLYYRLNGISLSIPPLRERTGEIEELVAAFIAGGCADRDPAERPSLSPEAMSLLLGYDWPGNVRELKNVIERALVLCDSGTIRPEHLPIEKLVRATNARSSDAPDLAIDKVRSQSTPPLAPSEPSAARGERERILAALAACASNQTRAARVLGISRRTLVSKLGLYGIPRPQKGPHLS